MSAVFGRLFGRGLNWGVHAGEHSTALRGAGHAVEEVAAHGARAAENTVEHIPAAALEGANAVTSSEHALELARIHANASNASGRIYAKGAVTAGVGATAAGVYIGKKAVDRGFGDAEGAAMFLGNGVKSIFKEGGEKAEDLFRGADHVLEGMANHIPNRHDITEMAESARAGAHGVMDELKMPALTIGAVLLTAVVVYEGYRLVHSS